MNERSKSNVISDRLDQVVDLRQLAEAVFDIIGYWEDD